MCQSLTIQGQGQPMHLWLESNARYGQVWSACSARGCNTLQIKVAHAPIDNTLWLSAKST